MLSLFVWLVLPKSEILAQNQDCYTKVSWSQISNKDNDFVGYYLYRRADGESYRETPITTISEITTVEYSDYSVATGNVYYYAVKSVDDVGNMSDFSADASIEVVCEEVGTTPISQTVVNAAQILLPLPGGEMATQTVINSAAIINKTPEASAVAVAISGAAAAAQAPTMVLNFPTILLGYIKRRKNKWGVVYDSKTKLPIGQAMVILSDNTGNVRSDITDKFGRFDFTVKPGKYTLSVRINNFDFPSKKIKGIEDDIYQDIYLGGEISISQLAINLNIPIDPIGNITEPKDLRIVYLKQKITLVVSKVSRSVFWLGLVWALASLLLGPSVFKLATLVGYFIIASFIEAGRFRNRWGKITDHNNRPVAKAIVRLSDMNHSVIDLAYTDTKGQYSFLVDPGKYVLSVDIVNIKDPLQSYMNVYTSNLKTVTKETVIRDKIKLTK